jgi:hypothetical protein
MSQEYKLLPEFSKKFAAPYITAFSHFLYSFQRCARWRFLEKAGPFSIPAIYRQIGRVAATVLASLSIEVNIQELFSVVIGGWINNPRTGTSSQ